MNTGGTALSGQFQIQRFPLPKDKYILITYARGPNPGISPTASVTVRGRWWFPPNYGTDPAVFRVHLFYRNPPTAI